MGDQHPDQSGGAVAVSGKYDIDLQSSGAGWTGTYGKVVATTASDILDDGPWGPIEIVYATSAGVCKLLGRLVACDPSQETLTVQPFPSAEVSDAADREPVEVHIADVVRFRA